MSHHTQQKDTHTDQHIKQTGEKISAQNAAEQALDQANELSFPASDPIATSNIQRITTVPDMAEASAEHPNSARILEASNAATETSIKSEVHNTNCGHRLDGLKIAALVTDGFEESELLAPKQALEELGAQVDVVANTLDGHDSLQAFHHMEKSVRVKIDADINKAQPDDYAGVLLPGGVINGDAMRLFEKAQDFVRQIDLANKPIAAICHGGWLLISANLVRGRTLTSWPGLQVDFENAGGKWIDSESVRDGNLITARQPTDIPAFNDAFIEALQTRQSSSADEIVTPEL